jgi:hypothetical protein
VTAVNEASAPESPWIRPLRVLIVVLALIAAGLVVWKALGGGGGDSGDTTATTATPRILSAEELRAVAAERGSPVYWAGARPGAELEYSEAAAGRVYVRYLTAAAKPGSPRTDFLTIGTYRLPDAAAALRANAKRTSTRLRKAPHGFLAWVNPSRPASVYLAKPGAAYQVEVYDPSPRRALSVALSPNLHPVPGD